MEQEVLQVEDTRVQALLQRDFAMLERIMADDCVHVESNGTVRTTAQFLAAFKAGDFAFDAFHIDENSLRLYGDTAVVIGRYSNRIRTGGTTLPTKRARHPRVYVKRAFSWQLVAHQATELTQ
jgi:ketosteroid isomerase-like protein